MFPREAMPMFFYALGNVIPLTFFLEIVRGIVLKGIGMQYLWSQLFALIAFSIAVFTASVFKFKKTLE